MNAVLVLLAALLTALALIVLAVAAAAQVVRGLRVSEPAGDGDEDDEIYWT